MREKLALLVWFVPEFAGGGEQLVQQLLSGSLVAGHAVPVVAGAIEAIDAPLMGTEGSFAPMLAMGAVQGALFCAVMTWWLPGIGLDWRICTIVGMGAMFASSVRAPLTGIVLILEMTATGRLVVPMLLACLPAAIIPFWLGLSRLHCRQCRNSKSTSMPGTILATRQCRVTAKVSPFFARVRIAGSG